MSKQSTAQPEKDKAVKQKSDQQQQEESEITRINPLPYFWKLITFSPWLFLGGIIALRSVIFAFIPQLSGLLTREFFNTLLNDTPVRWSPYTLVILMLVSAVVRSASIFADITCEVTFVARSRMLMRKNLFSRILEHPGARAVPGSPGEAVSRFRGDVHELMRFLNNLGFLTGQFLFTIIAFIVMLRINLRITFFVFIPMGDG